MIIRIHNAALQRGMTANEAKVYAYLIACSNRLNNAVVRIDTIRTACNIGSRSTVCSALQGLGEKGLVFQYRRRNREGDYIANGYAISPLRGGWFEVDTNGMEVFKLDKSSFLTYLFFLKCRRARSRKVFHSLNKIARALAVCKNTVIKAIKRLVALHMIEKSRPVCPGRLNQYIFLNSAGLSKTDRMQLVEISVEDSDVFVKRYALKSRFKRVAAALIGAIINSIRRLALFF